MSVFFDHRTRLFTLLPYLIRLIIRVVLLYRWLLCNEPCLSKLRFGLFKGHLSHLGYGYFINGKLGIDIPDHPAHSKQKQQCEADPQHGPP
ncbi:hypothetical protein D3C75_773670 [compost metagenome]